MKVLCVSAGLDAAFGGPPECAANSAIAARGAGVEVMVVFPHQDPAAAQGEPAVQKLVAAGVEVRAFGLARGVSGAARGWGVSWSLVRWIWRNSGRFDVIHARSAWAVPTLATTPPAAPAAAPR